MPITASELLKCITGREIHAGSLATCAVAFEIFSKEVTTDVFHPFSEFWFMDKGGAGLSLISVFSDWQNIHLARGIRPHQSTRNLADNYDHNQVMVLAAVTLIHLNRKKGVPESMKISRDEEGEFLAYCIGHNLADIKSLLHDKKGIAPSEEFEKLVEKSPDLSSRSYWKEALGHDLWIDASTQKPCACPRCKSPLRLNQIFWLTPVSPQLQEFGDHLQFSCTFCQRGFNWRGRKDENFIEVPMASEG